MTKHAKWVILLIIFVVTSFFIARRTGWEPALNIGIPDFINGSEANEAEEPLGESQQEINLDGEEPISNGSEGSFSGLDLEIRKCFAGDRSWENLDLKSDFQNFGDLLEDLNRVLGEKESDSIVYEEKTIEINPGEIRIIRFEIGTADTPSGNQLYWSKLDSEGAPEPIELPSTIKGDSYADFVKLSKMGSSKSIMQTRVIEYKGDIEISVTNKDGVISSIAINNNDKQVTCSLDPVKTYICECPF